MKTTEQQLWTAAQRGDCTSIRILVVEGVDLDARDEAGRTALHIATQYGQMAARKTLMAAKEMRALAAMGVLQPNNMFKNKTPLSFADNQRRVKG